VFYTSIKARSLSTTSALPPCHRTCATASLQAIESRLPHYKPSRRWPVCLSTKVQSATLPQCAKGATFTSASPSRPPTTPLAVCAPPTVIHDPSSPALHTGFIRATSERDDTGHPRNSRRSASS
jgi:hypothetical protein